ncbi:hypothetical protein Tco_0264567 [Tanacetum coccineum]
MFRLFSREKQEAHPKTQSRGLHSRKALSTTHGPLRANEDSKYQWVKIHIVQDRASIVTLGTFSSSLVPNLILQHLPTADAPRPVGLTGTPSSTIIDQDAPSPNSDPFFGVPIPEPNSEESFSKDLIPANTSQSTRGIFLNESKYALEILKKYGMETSNPMDTPMVEKSKLDEDPQGKAVDPRRYHGMIGSLMYLTSIKRIFRYLKGTINMGLWYSKDSCITLTAFADANHAGCQDTRKSTSGSMQLLGDDYAIALCCNKVQHSRSKYIDIIYHFIKEQVENGVVELYFVRIEYQLVDIFTKALGRERLEFLINKLGMRSMSPETLKRLAEEEE